MIPIRVVEIQYICQITYYHLSLIVWVCAHISACFLHPDEWHQHWSPEKSEKQPLHNLSVYWQTIPSLLFISLLLCLGIVLVCSYWTSWKLKSTHTNQQSDSDFPFLYSIRSPINPNHSQMPNPNPSPNLNLTLTLTVKPSLNPQTALRSCEARPTCPHSDRIKQICPENDINTCRHAQSVMCGVAEYTTATLSPDINAGSLTVIQGWFHIFQITVWAGHKSNTPTQNNPAQDPHICTHHR